MFHKVKNVAPASDFKLCVQFCEGVTKIYDVKPLFDKLPVFKQLLENPAEFSCVTVDVGGYGIVWNDDLDLSCDELWENGICRLMCSQLPLSELYITLARICPLMSALSSLSSREETSTSP